MALKTLFLTKFVNRFIGTKEIKEAIYPDLKQLRDDVDTNIADIATNATNIAALQPTYKVYTALLTQSGTAAPVATVLENTLGGTLVWARTGVGVYTATLNGAFPDANKVFTLRGIGALDDTQYGYDFTVLSANVIQIDTWFFDGVGLSNADDVLLKFPIEIRIYS